jgi:hypothetical protein
MSRRACSVSSSRSQTLAYELPGEQREQWGAAPLPSVNHTDMLSPALIRGGSMMQQRQFIQAPDIREPGASDWLSIDEIASRIAVRSTGSARGQPAAWERSMRRRGGSPGSAALAW